MTLDISPFRQGYFKLCRDCCKVFGFVLHKRFERLQKDGKELVGLTAFDADKSIRLLDKLWAERAMHLASNSPTTIQEVTSNGRLVMFPVNRHYNDKHGQRLAFPPAEDTPIGPARDQKPVLSVIESFDAKSLPTKRIFSVQEEDVDWGRLRRLVPQVSSGWLVPLIRSGWIDADDLSFLERLGESFGVMSARQIEAIGRHESAESTRESLIEEFKRWGFHTSTALRDVPLVIGGSEELTAAAARSLWQCWSFALECRRKVGLVLDDSYRGDKLLYNEALEALRQELRRPGLTGKEAETNALIELALERAQPSVVKIWADPRVSSLEFSAFCIWMFANYFSGTLKESPIWRDTILDARLKKLDRPSIVKSYDAVRRFVTVPRQSRPTSFSELWWNSINASETELAKGCIDPTKVWDGSISQDIFLAASKNVWDWLWEEHIFKDIEELRMQIAN